MGRRVKRIYVLIPNGMEFYKFKELDSSYGKKGFNSQRDGILLGSFFKMSEAEICFNSQRDGILLCADPIMAQNTKFQFPRR